MAEESKKPEAAVISVTISVIPEYGRYQVTDLVRRKESNARFPREKTSFQDVITETGDLIQPPFDELKLFVCANRLMSFPPTFRFHPVYHSLEKLSLDGLSIGEHTGFLAPLVHLYYLCLYDCDLVRVPPEIEGMEKLTHLNLDENPISEVPLFLSRMSFTKLSLPRSAFKRNLRLLSSKGTKHRSVARPWI